MPINYPGSGSPSDPSSFGIQAEWSWCSACSALFWGPGVNNSHCAGTGTTHNRGDTNYGMYFGTASTGTGAQDGWDWCSLCQELFWGNGDNAAGCCYGNYDPSNPNAGEGIGCGPHLPGSSTDYVMHYTS